VAASLTITPALHPDLRVREVGFDLTHPYVEQCWGQVLGPSATVLLRRLTPLWADGVPLDIERETLARAIGLGRGDSDGSRLMRSIGRCVNHRLATWHEPGQSLDVYLKVPSLTAAQLGRAPEVTRQAHDRLLESHVTALAASTGRPPIIARLDLVSRARPPLDGRSVTH